jgi:hypothetical protein
MKFQSQYGKLRKLSSAAVKTTLCVLPLYASAQVDSPYQAKDVSSVTDMFMEGHFSGEFRVLDNWNDNGWFTKGVHQNTLTTSTGVKFQTAKLDGFSMGASAYIARGLFRPSNPANRDWTLDPSLTTLGEAYLQWEHDAFKITVGDQELEDVPFTGSFDYRTVPQLFQGVTTRYGNQDNYVTAFRITKYKSWISDTYTNHTTYNSDFDSGSTIGSQTTPGFAGIGGAGTLPLDSVQLKGQAYYVNYMKYMKMTYLEGRVSRAEGEIKPYAAVQLIRETGSSTDLLGAINSQVYGFQLGVKRNSVDLSFGYDYTKPNADSYMNGTLITPYAHLMASGPLFAAEINESTQDLGAGSAYAIDINGKPMANLMLGARYTFLALASQPGGPKINQSEYLAYATYNFQGRLKGLSATDFFAVLHSPVMASTTFPENRFELQYAW